MADGDSDGRRLSREELERAEEAIRILSEIPFRPGAGGPAHTSRPARSGAGLTCSSNRPAARDGAGDLCSGTSRSTGDPCSGRLLRSGAGTPAATLTTSDSPSTSSRSDAGPSNRKTII